jgi:TonB family protein
MHPLAEVEHPGLKKYPRPTAAGLRAPAFCAEMDVAAEAAYDAAAMTSDSLLSRLASASHTGWLPVLCALACGPSQPPRAPAAPAPTSAAEAPANGSEPAAPSSTTPSAEPPTESQGSTGPREARGKDEIARVIADNRTKVRACYEAALKTNPGIAGDLVVSFIINPDGSVKNAEVNWSESELHVPELDSCTLEVVQAMKFPPSSRGLESKVNYPFNFNPQRP